MSEQGRKVPEAASLGGIGWVVTFATDDGEEYSAHFPDALYRAENRGSLFAALRYAGAPSLGGRGMRWLGVERYG